MAQRLSPEMLALTIDGSLTLEDVTRVLPALNVLLQALADEVAPGTPVQWRLVHLTQETEVCPPR